MKAVMLSITMKDSTLFCTSQPIRGGYECLCNWQLLTPALSPRITQQQSLAHTQCPRPCMLRQACDVSRYSRSRADFVRAQTWQ